MGLSLFSHTAETKALYSGHADGRKKRSNLIRGLDPVRIKDKGPQAFFLHPIYYPAVLYSVQHPKMRITWPVCYGPMPIDAVPAQHCPELPHRGLHRAYLLSMPDRKKKCESRKEERDDALRHLERGEARRDAVINGCGPVLTCMKHARTYGVSDGRGAVLGICLICVMRADEKKRVAKEGKKKRKMERKKKRIMERKKKKENVA
ncbi:hypothetical protein ACQKWADRAFT_287138 [Trichoderma austrokoningii]